MSSANPCLTPSVYGVQIQCMQSLAVRPKKAPSLKSYTLKTVNPKLLNPKTRNPTPKLLNPKSEALHLNS